MYSVWVWLALGILVVLGALALLATRKRRQARFVSLPTPNNPIDVGRTTSSTPFLPPPMVASEADDGSPIEQVPRTEQSSEPELAGTPLAAPQAAALEVAAVDGSTQNPHSHAVEPVRTDTQPVVPAPVDMPDDANGRQDGTVGTVPLESSTTTTKGELDSLTPERTASDPGERLDDPGSSAPSTREGRRTKLAPVKRGGRLRGPAPSTGPETVSDRQPLLRPLGMRKVELMCRRRHGVWQVGIAVEDDSVPETLIPFQAGRPLEWDPVGEMWVLDSLENGVSLHTPSEEPTVLDAANVWPLPLAFRLGSEESGRRVSGHLSAGRFLILIPEAWEVKPVGAARSLAAAERTSVPGVLAYPVLIESTHAAIDVLDEQRRSHALLAGKPRLELIGPCVEDLHPYQGPLFAPRAPTVRLNRRSDYRGGASDIVTLVVGQEGQVAGKRWKVQVDVATAEAVDLEELLERRSGWYFIRGYDSTDTLVDSVDFRYFAGHVRQIPAAGQLQHPASAEEDGFPVRIELPGDARLTPTDAAAHRCRFEEQEDPRDPGHAENNSNISGVQRTVTLFVSPDPDADRSLWTIYRGTEQDERVCFVVGLARLWWAFGEGDQSPDAWVAEPLERRLKELRPTSEVALWVRVDRSAVPELSIGPARDEALTYPVPANGLLSIGLRDFSSAWYRAANRRDGVVPLCLWIQSRSDGILLARFHPTYTCRDCGDEFEDEAKARDHLGAHWEKHFVRLPYQEARQYLDKSLPHYIYECLYCGHMVHSRFPESNVKKPTAEIERHIREECKKVPSGQGPRTVRYRAVNDIGAIREKLGLDVSDVYRCRACGETLVERDTSGLQKHLVQKHLDQLMTRS